MASSPSAVLAGPQGLFCGFPEGLFGVDVITNVARASVWVTSSSEFIISLLPGVDVKFTEAYCCCTSS